MAEIFLDRIDTVFFRHGLTQIHTDSSIVSNHGLERIYTKGIADLLLVEWGWGSGGMGRSSKSEIRNNIEFSTGEPSILNKEFRIERTHDGEIVPYEFGLIKQLKKKGAIEKVYGKRNGGGKSDF